MSPRYRYGSPARGPGPAAMSSQSQASAPVDPPDARSCGPWRSRQKTNGSSPESLWVHTRPGLRREAASPLLSPMAGSVTVPRTVAGW